MIRRILKVAKREYVETTKTKTFIIGTLMAPVIVGGIAFFTSRMAQQKFSRPAVKLAVTDMTGELSSQIETAFEEYNKSNPERQIHVEQVECEESAEVTVSEQKDRLRRGRVDMYVLLDEEIFEGAGTIHIYTHGTKASEIDTLWTIENVVNQAIFNRRCELKDVSPKLLDELRRHVPSEHVELSATGDKEQVQDKSERVVRMMMPFFFMYLMFFGIVVNGQQILTGLIEEKSSRVIEVLLSAVSPFELMSGKILGLVGIGLTVISVWGFAGYAAVVYKGWSVDITSELMLFFVIYYILGFLLFSSILAGVGSICNTLKEAQSLMMPVTLLFILPLLGWYNLVRDPNGAVARILSFVPPVAPMVIVLRLSASGDIWLVEILGSIVLLLASALFVMWVSSKVFRTGVLMYGKRPRLREVFRWLMQS